MSAPLTNSPAGFGNRPRNQHSKDQGVTTEKASTQPNRQLRKGFGGDAGKVAWRHVICFVLLAYGIGLGDLGSAARPGDQGRPARRPHTSQLRRHASRNARHVRARAGRCRYAIVYQQGRPPQGAGPPAKSSV